MPQLRIYHQGRYMYYQPNKAVHFLPPLSTPSISANAVSSIGSALSRAEEEREKQKRTRREVAYKRMVDFIGRSLTKENVDDLRFLAKEHIHPSHHLDRVMNGRSFLNLLQKQKLLAENSLHFLQTLLCYSSRADLYEVVFRFRYKTQDGFRRRGIDIDDNFSLSQDYLRVHLNQDAHAFQQSLKSHSRFQNVAIPDAQKEMEELTKLLDDCRPAVIGRFRHPKLGMNSLEQSCAEKFHVSKEKPDNMLPTIPEKRLVTKNGNAEVVSNVNVKKEPLSFLQVEGQPIKTNDKVFIPALSISNRATESQVDQRPLVKSKIRKLRQRIGVEAMEYKSVSSRLYNNMQKNPVRKRELSKPRYFKRKPRFNRPDRSSIIEMENRFAIMSVFSANNPIDKKI